MTALYDQYIDAFKHQSPNYYQLGQQLLQQYTDYAMQQGASPQEAQAYAARLGYVNFLDYGNGDPAAGWSTWQAQQANNLKNQQAEHAAGIGFSPGGLLPGTPPPTGFPPLAPPPASGGSGAIPPFPSGLPPSPTGYIYENGQWKPAPAQPGWGDQPAAGTPPPAAGGGGLPPPAGGGGGGAPYTPPPAPATGGGSPGSAYGAIDALLPGYGLSQNLSGFGIPGFETGSLHGGGSWAGTTFGPAAARAAPAPGAAPPPAAGTAPPPTNTTGGTWGWMQVASGNESGAPMTWVPVQGGMQGMPPGGNYDEYKNKMISAQADYLYNQNGGSYEDIVKGLMANDTWLHNTQPAQQQTTGNTTTAPPATPAGPGQFGIGTAKPYTGSPYTTSYGGKASPYASLQDQTAAAMTGVPTAYPGFAWASPGAMQRAQPSATGTPPGGWTQMLGYTPGAPSNYGFPSGRPNPYGFANLPLTINPAAG
jgi:hypothetical protein